MIREAIGTAKSVDEAIDAGCLLLGVDRDKVEFEIIDLPKRGFFKRKAAKVRVFIDVPEPKAAPAPRRPEPKPQQQPQRPKPEARPENKPKQQERQAPANDNRAEQKPRPAQQKPQQPQQPKPQPKEQPAPIETIEPTPEVVAKAELAVNYVASILKAMDLENATVKPVYTQNGISLALAGEGLGVIIGRRGETLDSLQYLVGLVANRIGGDYVRITIDSGNYRQKRETTLEGLARKLANQVVRTGKSCTLEPMNPYERRIIHAAVSQIKGATSSSVGEEPNRRVVISTTGDRPAGGSNDRSNDRRNNGGRGGHKPPHNRNNKPRTTNPSEERGNRGGYRDYRDERPVRNDNRPKPAPQEQAAAKPVQEPKPEFKQEPKPEFRQEPRQDAKPAKERSLHEAELGGKLYGKIDF